ncbi:MAG: L,D-transpeptidase family protein [Bosea sp.]|jgi:murein L,D-transpeptidase YcbB/YkuD|nr:L,D-transpeptidase family protein [Bosea sp. (in: a-proteobacteria)]
MTFDLTRRQTLFALLSGAATISAASPAWSGVEWRQSYDAVQSRSRIVRSSTPMVSPAAAAATEQALARYRDLAAQGGWQQIGPERLRLGSRGQAVVALRNRLIIAGDLDASAAGAATYDSFVEQAVRRFQARHGLTQTGALNPGTTTALNVPVETRIRQLELNIVRLRAFSGNLGQRHVIVNIPAAMVETVENGVVATRHAAGVGKIDRQSPILQTRIPEVNFNPTWTVPASIIRKDLIPKMRKEPNYLAENRIRIINAQGQQVPPETVNWNSDEATRYTFRQDPGGEFNSLGFVRINIPSPHGVYMHDTPAKGIFGDDYRFVSSGCVRVQNVRDYIQWLLKDTSGWDRTRIDQVFESGERVNAPIPGGIPVYWTYVTAWATAEGDIHFRDDIYQKDGLGALPMAKLQGGPEEE